MRIKKTETELLQEFFRTDLEKMTEMEDFVEFPKGATIFLKGMNMCPFTGSLKQKLVFPDLVMEGMDKIVLEKTIPTFLGIKR